MGSGARLIRVILIEEQKVIREGLRILLESEHDIQIVGSFSSGYDAISKMAELQPDIILISTALSQVNNFDLIKVIQAEFDKAKIVVFCNEVEASDFVQYLELGVKGCLLKNISAGKIRELVRYIDQGYTHIEDDIFQAVVPQLSDAISAWQIVNSQGKEASDDLESTVNFNNNWQLSPFDYGQSFSENNATYPSYVPLFGDVSLGNSFPSNLEKPPAKAWWKRGITKLTLAGLGVSAIAISLFSYRREAEIVIQDGVVNGKIVSIESPVAGTLQKVNYFAGMNLESEQLFASIELAKNSDADQRINQLDKDIVLKQEQINNATNFLSFLQRELAILPQKSQIAINVPQGPEPSTISIDNTREIAHLEQQIFHQKSTINFLGQELRNLQAQRKKAQAELGDNQIIPLKAPISGVVHQINYSEGEFIPAGQEIATLVDCQNLWVEGLVNSRVAAKINLQEDVSVQLEAQENKAQENLVSGKINFIENLSQENTIIDSESFPSTSAVAIKQNNNYDESLYRVIINVEFSVPEAMVQDYCQVGSTAIISINK